jgi:hypothetical protein
VNSALKRSSHAASRISVKKGNIKSFFCCKRLQVEEYLDVFNFFGVRIQPDNNFVVSS